ncbi:hypothetical protein BCR33DRAFT_766688 [Rhizoclosmatium globosum]|uniref:Periplasmic binding protein-like II n=1 Tax=Rhizoclosmatium globosum TaxID=329046 RepID=A0A1Y2C7I1_9FUNG|nr:hypothetical protein BCR33DRAFT_766688 [Rhizoclosmatium globosum]|eukprot:ORY42983.1 hypothetical protein BCR33DRAFT_766688 [Rhizoclosmatium globosum]
MHLLSFAAALSLSQLGCNAQSSGCPLSSAPFASVPSIKYAKNFAVTGSTDYMLTLKVGSQTITLSACNNPSGSVTGAITVPVASVGVQQQTVTGFLQRLNKEAAITAIGASFATTPCSLSNASASGSSTVTFGSGAIDVQTAIQSEQSALAQAEWIVFFDAFFAFTGQGTASFATTVNTYSCLKQKAASYVSSKAGVAGAQPVAVISAVDLSSNTVVTPEPALTTFWKSILSDAGVVPLVASDVSSFQNLARTADFVVDVTNEGTKSYDLALWSKIYSLNTETPGYYFLNGFNSFIFRFDKLVTTNGFDDFENSAPSQPETLLADIIGMLSSKTFDSKWAPTWARNLAYSAGYRTVSSNCPSSFSLSYSFCNTSPFNPTIGRFFNPTGTTPLPGAPGYQQSNSTAITTTLIGGIVGGIIAGLALIALRIYLIGRKRALNGIDKPGQSYFGWVKDAIAGRQFATLEEEGGVVAERIEAVHATRNTNGIQGGALGSESAGALN